MKTNTGVLFQISSRCKSYPRGLTTRSVASRKVVLGNQSTGGSETAKSGTDEQKVHKRHSNKDEYPQQYEVQNSVLNMLLNQIIVM